jgi:glycosyltransferase involved in cell wall biosynthesis
VNTILLSGPELLADGAYAAGAGGAARNVRLYLEGFRSDRFRLVHAPTTVRQPGDRRRRFVSRIVTDAARLARARGDGVHIVAQYRTAIYREAMVAAQCRIRGIPVLYHIKAGAFLDFLAGRRHQRLLAESILRNAGVILCEGEPYVAHLRSHYGLDPVYFPNFVPDEELGPEPGPLLSTPALRVLFVGTCYHGKGVFELLDGAIDAAASGVPLELVLMGKETDDFRDFADRRCAALGALPLTVKRMGVQPHGAVLEAMRATDVFIMPSRHPGEGHTNAVNEAMAAGRALVATRHGFLPTVLSEDCCLFLEALTPEAIAAAFVALWADPERVRAMGEAARARLLSRYTGSTLWPRLEASYARLVGG